MFRAHVWRRMSLAFALNSFCVSDSSQAWHWNRSIQLGSGHRRQVRGAWALAVRVKKHKNIRSEHSMTCTTPAAQYWGGNKLVNECLRSAGRLTTGRELSSDPWTRVSRRNLPEKDQIKMNLWTHTASLTTFLSFLALISFLILSLRCRWHSSVHSLRVLMHLSGTFDHCKLDIYPILDNINRHVGVKERKRFP